MLLALLWVTANFHAHAASDRLRDDGSETPAQLHRALRARGFDFSVHSAHSVFNEKSAEEFRLQRADEARAVAGMTCVLGEELTLANGPHYQGETKVLGRDAPGNLNHLTVFGMKELIPSGTTVADACDRAHAEGGVCIVDHPGPGPMMWEEGLWEAPAARGKIDALEVYNGQALSAVAIDFESRYLEATSYGGLGLKIAAVTGADTHGPKSVERARAKLAGLGLAGKLLKLVAPGSNEPRAELDAMTRVRAASSSESDVIAALQARRTIALYALRNLRVELDGLGEVKRTGAVALDLRLSRAVGEIVLYREGKELRRWANVSEARFTETITQAAAYVFAARDGAGRLMTSAVWFEPR